jgi:hypothetical protein
MSRVATLPVALSSRLPKSASRICQSQGRLSDKHWWHFVLEQKITMVQLRVPILAAFVYKGLKKTIICHK